MLWEFTTIIRVREELKPWKNRLSEKKKLAAKKAKRQAKVGFSKDKEEDKTIPLDQIITLDHLTNPDKK